MTRIQQVVSFNIWRARVRRVIALRRRVLVGRAAILRRPAWWV